MDSEMFEPVEIDIEEYLLQEVAQDLTVNSDYNLGLGMASPTATWTVVDPTSLHLPEYDIQTILDNHTVYINISDPHGWSGFSIGGAVVASTDSQTTIIDDILKETYNIDEFNVNFEINDMKIYADYANAMVAEIDQELTAAIDEKILQALSVDLNTPLPVESADDILFSAIRK